MLQMLLQRNGFTYMRCIAHAQCALTEHIGFAGVVEPASTLQWPVCFCRWQWTKKKCVVNFLCLFYLTVCLLHFCECILHWLADWWCGVVCVCVSHEPTLSINNGTKLRIRKWIQNDKNNEIVVIVVCLCVCAIDRWHLAAVHPYGRVDYTKCFDFIIYL